MYVCMYKKPLAPVGGAVGFSGPCGRTRVCVRASPGWDTHTRSPHQPVPCPPTWPPPYVVTRPEAVQYHLLLLTFRCHLVAAGLKSSTWPKENRRNDPSQRPEALSVPRGSRISWGTRQKHTGWRRDGPCLRPWISQPKRAQCLPCPHTAHPVSRQTVRFTRLVTSPL